MKYNYIAILLLLFIGCSSKPIKWHTKKEPCDRELYDCRELP